MCRYAFSGPYKDHFACFACRKCFKRAPLADWPEHLRTEDGDIPTVRCPQCAAPMVSMGLDFKAPKKDDVRQWQKVQTLYSHGFTFHSCGCGPGLRPAELRDVAAFLRDSLPRTAGEALLRTIDARAGSRRVRPR